MLDKRIKFDERYDSEECGTTTLYFIAPKEMLTEFTNNDYPDAVSMEISVEFPTNHHEAKYADVCVSPTMYEEEDDCYTDYDWTDIDLPYEEVEELIKLGGM